MIIVAIHAADARLLFHGLVIQSMTDDLAVATKYAYQNLQPNAHANGILDQQMAFVGSLGTMYHCSDVCAEDRSSVADVALDIQTARQTY